MQIFFRESEEFNDFSDGEESPITNELLYFKNALTDNINSHSKAFILPFTINEQACREESHTSSNNLPLQNCLLQNSTSSSNVKRLSLDTNSVLSQLDLRSNNDKTVQNENQYTITSLPFFNSTINNPTGTSSFYTKPPLIVTDPLELQNSISHNQNNLVQYQQYQQQSFPLIENYQNQTQLYGVASTEEDELAATTTATWNNNFAAMHWMAAAAYNEVTNNSINNTNLSTSANQNSFVQQQNQILLNSTSYNIISRPFLTQYDERDSLFNSDQQPTTLSNENSLIPLNLASTSNENFKSNVNVTNDSIKSNTDKVSYRNL